MKLSKIVKRYRVDNPRKFKLVRHRSGRHLRPRFRQGRGQGDAGRQHRIAWPHLQELLYAQDQWAILLVFQAMDAAGKDGVIKHVMSGVNPQGCDVHAFKAPTAQELDHDFLWRAAMRLPERGRIGIFNRSYYEEVLVVRVHPEFLERQKLPPAAGRQEYLGRALQGHSRLRASSRQQRHENSQISFARLEGRAAATISRPARPSDQALEIFHGRHRRAQAVGQIHGRL